MSIQTSGLYDNLSSPADHSHFQLVIEHLKEVAAQEKENSCRDDSTGFPGDEEEVNPDINVRIHVILFFWNIRFYLCYIS